MKKTVLALTAAILVFTMCLCGCSSNGSSKESSTTESVASKASESVKLQTLLDKVKSEIEMPADTSDFNETKMKRTFGIEADMMDDFAGLYCTDGLRQDQIVYVKAKNAEAADTIEKKLQDNWQSKYNVIKNYSPEQVAIIESAKVEKNGLYVSLVISADADKIKSIFNEGIK